jgi:hypothetical protein
MIASAAEWVEGGQIRRWLGRSMAKNISLIIQ